MISKDARVPATIRFVGPTKFAAGTWVGVELETPSGKNNGTVQGEFYFDCPANYGLFLREENVFPLLDGISSPQQPSASTSSTDSPSIKGRPPPPSDKSKSASRLKLKLSQLMNLLNHQLVIVEDLEKEEKTDPNSAKAVAMRREIQSVTDQELETIQTFRSKWLEFI